MNWKILFIARTNTPLGGVATWLDYITPGLQSQGWNVSIALTDGYHHDAGEYLRQHPFPDADRLLNRTGTTSGRIQCLSAVIKKRQPDLICVSNLPDAYGVVNTLRVSGETTARVVMAHHELFYGDVSFYKDVLDGVICTGRLAAKLAVELGGLEAARSFYAPCGVSPVPKDERAVFQHSQPLRVGFAGRLETTQKRVEDLIGIARKLHLRCVDFELIIAGGGPAEGLLRAELSDLTEAGRVRFLGKLSNADLFESFYRCIDALLITSSWETGPIVAWEAMACDVALVTSDYIGNKIEGSLVHNENCLKFPIGDTAAAANLIVELTNPTLRACLIANGRALIMRRYSREASIRSWSECLNDIMRLPRRDAARLPRLISPSGRLDRCFGHRVGEKIRSLLKSRTVPHFPGDEWPHGHGLSDKTFWEQAAAADA
jgi:glycosyltransferase involved in cell wall biosynthesis